MVPVTGNMAHMAVLELFTKKTGTYFPSQIETPKAKSTPATPKKGSKKKSPRKGKRKHPSKSPSGQKAPGDPRKRGIANANSELLGIPMLEFGWCREIVYRRSADSNFADVYYHSPQPHSKKFRSKCQIGIERKLLLSVV